MKLIIKLKDTTCAAGRVIVELLNSLQYFYITWSSYYSKVVPKKTMKHLPDKHIGGLAALLSELARIKIVS